MSAALKFKRAGLAYVCAPETLERIFADYDSGVAPTYLTLCKRDKVPCVGHRPRLGERDDRCKCCREYGTRIGGSGRIKYPDDYDKIGPGHDHVDYSAFVARYRRRSAAA